MQVKFLEGLSRYKAKKAYPSYQHFVQVRDVDGVIRGTLIFPDHNSYYTWKRKK